MSNEDIVNAMLKRKGYVQYAGNKDNLSAIIHFFLMDASYQTFMRRKWDCQGKEKRILKDWSEGYRLFFVDFKSAYTQDQYNGILDKVDDFEASLAHHLNIAEIALQEAGNDEPLEIQKEVSCCWMANLLANDARDFYGEVWKTGLNHPMHNRYIDQVCRASKEYGKRHDKTLYLSDRQIKRIEDSVHVIANKICEWVFKDYENEKAKKYGTGKI